ncbi:MAG: flavin reductase family protein [Actinomycetota bacterium]|nr:flavin reductase family protein [Actinomycetota bacterium]
MVAELTPDDLRGYNATIAGLRPIPVAVTTAHGGRANGLITLSAGSASIVPEAPRVVVSITTYNFSHDLIRDGGVFVLHALSNAPELIEASLTIMRALGGRSGRDGDKMAGLRTRVGVTGAPILLDALTFVEARVLRSLDNEENTFFVGDVVAAGRLNAGGKLDIGAAWAGLGDEWTDAYEHDHEAQIDDSRARRGLPTLHA